MSPIHPVIPGEVTLSEISDEWHVAVREGEDQPSVLAFTTEEFALNYAEGQRLRLGLEKVVRL